MAATAFHTSPRYLDHEMPAGHPECGARISALLESDWYRDPQGWTPVACERAATADELARAHGEGYIETIAGTDGKRGALDADTFVSPASYQTALRSAGAALELADRIVAGEFDNGMVATRPPGHHAERDRAMGFCFFGNVAVTARHLTDHHGLERVLVVDYDVHHGNGTQDILYDDPRALFVSLHQYPFYPGTGNFEEVGSGRGEGFTVNVPLPAGLGSADYARVFDEVVVPVADAFAPQFVLLSAGFDAHHRDPLGGMRVDEDGFDAMNAALLGVADRHCDGRVLVVLEGGYDLGALSSCVERTLARLSNPAKDAPDVGENIAGVTEGVIERARSMHATRWKL